MATASGSGPVFGDVDGDMDVCGVLMVVPAPNPLMLEHY